VDRDARRRVRVPQREGAAPRTKGLTVETASRVLLGAFVVIGVQSLQSNLVREFDFTKNQSLPSLFIVDIQRSQVEGLKQLLKTRTSEEPQIIPTVRARIAFVNGELPIRQSTQMNQQRGQIGREFAVTYREELESNEKVIAGTWFGKSDAPEVSVEEQMARRLAVKIGDTITFDISGRKVHTRVTSVRKLDLRNTRTAFIFVFAPGVLEKAPQAFAANVLSKLSETKRQKLQREIVDTFPNAQIFDVADILRVVQSIIGNFVLAISFVGTFVILSGMLILMGSVALTKSQRIYENAILKTLGARRMTLAGILFAEYGLLGFLAGLIGVIFATALSYAVSRHVLDIQWELDFALIAIGISARCSQCPVPAPPALCFGLCAASPAVLPPARTGGSPPVTSPPPTSRRQTWRP